MPFILVTCLFSLWGFANDITNPMVAAFKNILLISYFQSSLVQFAFYGGYCVMAIPAALFIKRFSYKTGILLGLTLYAVGCLMSDVHPLRLDDGFLGIFDFVFCDDLRFIVSGDQCQPLYFGDGTGRNIHPASEFRPVL